MKNARPVFLTRLLLPGVVSFLGIVIPHQVTVQLLGVLHGVPRHDPSLTLLHKGVVVVFSVYLQGRHHGRAGDQGYADM